MEQKVPSSFDDFFKSDTEIPKDKKDPKLTKRIPVKKTQVKPIIKSEEQVSVEKRFEKERLEWTSDVKEMAMKLKKIHETAELMTTIYSQRQKAHEYYHYLVSLLIKINRDYKKQWAIKYEFYTYKGQQRFPNESTKTSQINADLADVVMKREVFDNHMQFMAGTIKTMDNIIFGIKTRVEIEQIARGK